MAYNTTQQSEKLVKNTERFLKDYRVRARITERRVASPSYQPFDYEFKNGNSFSDYHTTFQYHPILELELSEEDLDRLVVDIEDYKQIRMQYGNSIGTYLNNAHDYAQQVSYEARMRKENPGVQLAWEKYQLMLKIAGGE